jgi:hypothetical protein
MLSGATMAGSAMSWSVSVKLPVTRTQASSSNSSYQPGQYTGTPRGWASTEQQVILKRET